MFFFPDVFNTSTHTLWLSGGWRTRWGRGEVRPRSTYLHTQLSALTGGLAVKSDARRRFDSTLGQLSFLSLKTVWFQCGQCLVTAASRRSIIYKTFVETVCTAAHLV